MATRIRKSVHKVLDEILDSDVDCLTEDESSTSLLLLKTMEKALEKKMSAVFTTRMFLC